MLLLIYKIASVTAKILKFFLFKLFLWLPALFVIGYFILFALMGWPFFYEPGQTILIAGSVILIAVALTLSIALRVRKMSKSDGGNRQQNHNQEFSRRSYASPVRHSRPSAFEDDFIDDDYYDYVSNRRRWGDLEPPLEYSSYNKKSDPYYSKGYNNYDQDNYTDYSSNKKKWGNKDNIKEETTTTVVEESFIKPTTKEDFYSTPTGDSFNKNNNEAPAPARHSSFSKSTHKKDYKKPMPNEKPLVFCTRKDPDVLILEYSDRLMYFKKNPNGGEPEFMAEEFKS